MWPSCSNHWIHDYFQPKWLLWTKCIWSWGAINFFFAFCSPQLSSASVRAGIPLTWNHSLTTPLSNTEVLFLALLTENQKDVKQGWLRWKRIAPAGHHLLALNDAAYLEERWKAFVLELNVHPEFHLICRLDYSPVTEGGPRWWHLPKSQASISHNVQLTWCQIYLESVLTLPSINTPSLRFIHRILGKLTIALNLSGPVTAACPQTERLLCNIYQGLLPLRRGFITELLIYKNEAQN